MSGPSRRSMWQAEFTQEWKSYDALPSNRFETLLNLEAEMQADADLRATFPALQSAWEHYQIMLRMCRDHDDKDAD